MAWLSTATSNDKLVDHLLEYDLVKSECIVEALRTVDRRFFVPKSSQDHAYFDHPMKEGNIHISAPHMYCTVAENLELVPNSNLSFLNIGSGTGYFSCLVGQILGPKSTSFAVELHADVIEHAKRAVQGWKIERAHDIVTPEIKFFHGNGFNIKLQGESRLGYDRIYVGGSIDRFQLPLIENLLAPGGILVAPVEDSLVKVRRSRIEGTHHEIITSVYYAKLAENPKLEVLIPSTVWDPALHYTFPSDFHESIWALLLCANSPSPRVNSAASIPKDIWLYIFRYMNKNWFKLEDSEMSSRMEVDHPELLTIDQAEFDSSNDEETSKLDSLPWMNSARTKSSTQENEVFNAEEDEEEEMSDVQTSLNEDSVHSEEVDKIRSVSI